MNKIVKGGDLSANVVSPEAAWEVLVNWVLDKQPHPGQLVIPSGANTGLFARVTTANLPFGVAFDVLEAGIRKPITDISIDKKVEGDNWHHAHERRLKRLANWKEGNFSVRGGSKDELAPQMKIEFTEMLKLAGLNPDSPKHKELFKGTIVQMFDAWEESGRKFKDGREAKLTEVREAATKKLASRGKAADELDTSALEI
jgi:hypothetical protein